MKKIVSIPKQLVGWALSHPIWAGISGLVGLIGLLLAPQATDFSNAKERTATMNQLAAIQKLLEDKLEITSRYELEMNTQQSYVRTHWSLSDVQQIASNDSFVSSVSPDVTGYLQYQCRLITTGIVELIVITNPRAAAESEEVRKGFRMIVETYRLMVMKMIVVAEAERLRLSGKISDSEIAFVNEFPWDQVCTNPAYLNIMDGQYSIFASKDKDYSNKSSDSLRNFEQKYPRILPLLRPYISKLLTHHARSLDVPALSEKERQRIWSIQVDTGDPEPISGIGARLSQTPNGIEVQDVIDGSAAYASGLTKGDLIVEVDGIIVAGKSLEGVVALVRGSPGSIVRLLVRRASNQTQLFELKRERIKGVIEPRQ
jgi:hypothetical protein